MTTSLLKLRDYQKKCIEKIGGAVAEGHRRIAAVLATGGGKTIIFSQLTADHLDAHPGNRVLILAHTDELVTQAAEKFRSVCTKHTVGIVKAERDEHYADVVVASVQTLRNVERRDRIKNVGLVIVDECHHAKAATYLAILEHFGCFDESACLACDGKGYRLTPDNPLYGVDCDAPSCVKGKVNGSRGGGRALALGFTATMTRGDGENLGDVWQAVPYKLGISHLVKLGYLKVPRGIAIRVPDLDLSTVKTSRGDYQDGALGEAVAASMAPEIVAKAYVEHAAERSGIIFTPTVDSAYVMAEAVAAEGIKCEVVHGALPRDQRRDIIARFTRGEIQVLANCMVLTEGFDAPIASCAVICRPTKNTGLYQQMVGRVLRPYQGMDALIIDVTGVAGSHSLASIVDLLGDEAKQSRKCPPGEDCGDLEEEASEETGAFVETVYHTGPTVAEDFDPLAASSDRVWLTTERDGIPFLGAGKDHYIFVMPSTLPDARPGTWDVCWCTKDLSRDMAGGWTEHRGIDLGYAMAWGELEADERGGEGSSILTAKKKRWRSEQPSDPQILACRRAGIVIPEGSRKGDVSILIDRRNATRRLEPIVRAINGSA